MELQVSYTAVDVDDVVLLLFVVVVISVVVVVVVRLFLIQFKYISAIFSILSLLFILSIYIYSFQSIYSRKTTRKIFASQCVFKRGSRGAARPAKSLRWSV